ncbi:GNAT family N-acetyltransferase [Halocatena halophila]|uniref:GNAT family N-acetyltransferase n=1 Tax=Halocatena halophila TaxID=2814576 RepID=UPI002ED48F7C
MLRIEPLGDDDLAPAMALSTQAGWNQCPADWERLFELAPDGCFGGYVDGELVATTTVLTFDRAVAWIGMVLVAQPHRQQGFGSTLFERGLSYAREQAAAVGLDATTAGRGLYERQGFRDTHTVERWAGLPTAGATNTVTIEPATEIAPVIDCDRTAVGPNRTALLNSIFEAHETTVLLAGTQTNPLGYVMVRPGRQASQIGPLVAPDASTASALLGAVGHHTAVGDCLLDVIASEHTNDLLRAHGFERQRVLTRMTHESDDPLLSDPHVWAIADFALG